MPGVTNAENQLILQRLWTLTIQCHYDEEYRVHVKYWCRMRTQSSCTTIVSTDTPERRGQVSITDDSTHNVFYVTMRDLKMMDSDVYWCGVETSNRKLYMASLNLTVTAGAVGLSVFNNMLTGKTGENVSVQSFYSERNRDQEKKWCRRGDWSSCLIARGNRTSQDRVQLEIDDRRRLFTVTVRGLESNDMGWYWITAGDQQFPVHVNVGFGNTCKTVSKHNIPTYKGILHKYTQDIFEGLIPLSDIFVFSVGTTPTLCQLIIEPIKTFNSLNYINNVSLPQCQIVKLKLSLFSACLVPQVTKSQSYHVVISSFRIEILHVLLHISTFLLYTICTVVAVTTLWSNSKYIYLFIYLVKFIPP
uniref:Immunoglobulin domain-containing protein n=1 Tax=Scleropages formosus TaxID=113540 RepID=A0A8C9RTF6_SCLFO